MHDPCSGNKASKKAGTPWLFKVFIWLRSSTKSPAGLKLYSVRIESIANKNWSTSDTSNTLILSTVQSVEAA